MRIPSCASVLFSVVAILAAPFAATAVPRLPNINTNNIITITSAPYNAVGNGITDNTLAISNAIVAASAGPLTGGLVGGQVRIPSPGVFLTGPLTLRNNVDIHVDPGATLRMLPLNLYTNYPPASGSGETYGNLFYAAGLTNMSITGTGVIDGQGSPWWSAPSPLFDNRPYMIYFNSACKQVLIQGVTISNAPAQLVVFKGKGANITALGLKEYTTPSFGANASHNTDGIDLVGTNILIQDCIISVGDDDLALGTSSAGTPTADMVVTNCAFGDGHGVSIGSNTAGGVSNLTVINCTFNGTEYGIRLKSDHNPSSGGAGGVAQDLRYYNLGMTNIVRCPIVIYSYYSEYGTPTNITPFMASTQAVGAALIPIWRNVTISNLTATLASGGGPAGIIWGRIEMPATNFTLSRINITATRSFDVYNAYGVQFLDSQITVPGSDSTLDVFNAGIVLSNSAPGGGVVTIDALTSTNSLALYNAQASMTANDAFGTAPISVNAATLTISNSLSLPAASAVNFALGTSAAKVVATGNLVLNSTLNLTAASGFGPGTYTLFNYTGGLGGTPVLGATPATGGHSWLYRLDTNTAGQINFVVATPPPPVFSSVKFSGTNLVLSGTGGTTNFSYYMLMATNLSLPLSQWTRIATNQFQPNGSFAFTNGVAANPLQKFYLLQYP